MCKCAFFLSCLGSDVHLHNVKHRCVNKQPQNNEINVDQHDMLIKSLQLKGTCWEL